jgi:hypothetical protein
MARNRGKKALYEVMSKTRVKPEQGKMVEHPPPQRPAQQAAEAEQKPSSGVPKSAAKWRRKPRIVQLNAGRFEFSMPYQMAVAFVLVFVLLIIAAYRFGQSSGPAGRRQAGEPGNASRETAGQTPAERAMTDVPQSAAASEAGPVSQDKTSTQDVTPKTEAAEPAKPEGDNVIVLVQYDSLPDLAPVQAHFSEYGIETEIVAERGHYFLQTKERYDNPERPGTDGYKAKQRIAEVGAKYKGKAPAGYETFAPRYFSDAYGKKVD